MMQIPEDKVFLIDDTMKGVHWYIEDFKEQLKTGYDYSRVDEHILTGLMDAFQMMEEQLEKGINTLKPFVGNDEE